MTHSAAPIADWSIDDPNYIALRRTPRVCDFFNANAIMFGEASLSVDPNAVVRIMKHGPVEQYTLFGGDFAHQMGAFSYNHSQAIYLQAGRYCSIGNGLDVFGERHPLEWVTTSNVTYSFHPFWNKPHFLRAHAELMGSQWTPLTPPDSGAAPILAHDVWIAEHVALARNIRIGTGAIVARGAVVTKDVAPYMIVGGNPARPIRLRFAEALCERLLASRWWEHHPDYLFKLDSTRPSEFLDALDAAKAAGTITPNPVTAFTWREMIDAIASMPADGI